jgi:hypothetical protein
MGAPFITTIIARVLAITDYFLNQWVTVSTYSQASPNGCWSFDVQNATLNACGQEFLSNLTDVVEGVVALVPDLLGGLFAFGTPATV